LRFEVLSQAYPLEGLRVLDVGCGLGDFWGWAREHNLELEYTGIDITPKMVEMARRRFPEVQFELCNLLDDGHFQKKRYDVVLASGIFAHRRLVPFMYMQRMVKAMFSLCNRAVAFNSLSLWAQEQDEGEFYADPLKTVKYCRALTPYVVLRHDYHPRDFTIYMYRQRVEGQ
jgi:2-polyprenyl-3-methyl-5-hydroxy-6-metoxy-1,4-benzoquinol methylase